jgi:hypothetical protein
VSSWDQLADELHQWHLLGSQPTLWWRDDDAQYASKALTRLNNLSIAYAIPLHLAVIPEGSDASLLSLFRNNLRLYGFQHGYAHTNHASKDQRKCELGDHRPLSSILSELVTGKDQLASLLGSSFTPILVPPWNRLSAKLPKQLAHLGFKGLSTLGPRDYITSDGLHQVNVHVDIIDWKQQRFAGEQRVLGQLVSHLSSRRQGVVDSEEATGVMTHHLAHDEACWSFCERLFQFCEAQALVWVPASRLFDTK